MMDPPLVSVGIVSWNSARFLPACLESLAGQHYPHIELIVVDNASSDGSPGVLPERFSQAVVIRNSVNRGFAGGHNQAIRASHGRYYLPLNPDVVLDPGYVSAMLSAMARAEDVGMVAAKLYLGTPDDQPRVIDSTGLFIDRKRRQYLRGFNQIDAGQYARVEEVFGVDGAAPLYRRSMLEAVCVDGEYFDESFHSHKEDVDLSWRARLLGWRCLYTPDAVGYHLRAFRPGSRKMIEAETRLHAVKNRYLLLLKNETSAGWNRDWASILFYDLKILAYLLVFERSSLKAFSLLKNSWSRAKRWRVEIQSRSRVDPVEFLHWFTP